MGGTVWFFGESGMQVIVGNEVRPFGWQEVGHLFDTMSLARVQDVVVKNYLGQLVTVFYSTDGVLNNKGLAYDQRFGGWSSIVGWRVVDALVQKAPLLGTAQSMLFVDPFDRDPGGPQDYRIFIGFNGDRDDRNADGSGGLHVPFLIETPDIDDGSPDVLKNYERLQVFAAADNLTNIGVSIVSEPDGMSRALALNVSSAGTLWGTALWGSFKWGTRRDSHPYLGLEAGFFGTRYRLRVTGRSGGGFKFKGFVLDAILLPERRLS